MYYSKKELSKLRKQGEKYLEEMEDKRKGHKYKSEAGLNITCLHCGHDLFEKGEALLNTRGMTFFDLDWLNGSAVTLMCTQCGFIHWFGKNVQQL